MRALSPPAAMRATAVQREPLQTQLSRYPTLDAPETANTSMRHMQAMARRANSTAGRSSVLRDFLSTV